jgi:LacI family transcriptional regulator
MDQKILRSLAEDTRLWRGPTIVEIAAEAGVGTATVDRVLNARSHVRGITREKVLAALGRLKAPRSTTDAQPARIAFISDSGLSFNQTLELAVRDFVRDQPNVECPFIGMATSKVDPVKLANQIERSASEADGLVIVAREDIIINRAIRNVVARKTPVVCLTTDLLASGRHAYVGSDQTAAGATAAYLMGQVVGNRPGKILVVYSAPYRGQEERELGFRRVLRTEFSRLEVDERVNSNDDAEYVYQNVVRYIHEHGEPAGVYNVAGGNIGIGKALKDYGLAGKVVFIGHELNANSRTLLETGVMHFAIGHDVNVEVAHAIGVMLRLIRKEPFAAQTMTRVRIYTKYTCN